VLVSWIDSKCGLVNFVQSFRASDIGSLVRPSNPTWRGKEFMGFLGGVHSPELWGPAMK